MKSKSEVVQSIATKIRRPGVTFWTPLGFLNRYYSDTDTWEKEPSEHLMKDVNTKSKQLDHEQN